MQKKTFLALVGEICPPISSPCLHFLPAWLPGYHNVCYPAVKIAESQYENSSEEQVFTTLQRVRSLQIWRESEYQQG